ncbi:alpha/beta fold hydrolase [Corynebacterium sp. A21]|uniref:alpha/beta fold hydrolase n=1 Tax=Corynebacterium sp. A21 TaxID=3457318 RepID=UPI003FD668F1
MALRTSLSTRLGHQFREHRLTVPWNHRSPGETLEIFAREITPPGGQDFPVLLYLQGGPGFPAPRPVDLGGWLGEALNSHRVILLDQRGTGHSERIDAASPYLDAEHLRLLRADQIVADCEALRQSLGIRRWSLMGQSFGGFCITTYLSTHPESVDFAYLTGGLPSTDAHADDIYRGTFSKLATRHETFYAEIPWAEDRIREICHHLNNTEELLATGEQLSSRRFRTIGSELGRGTGFDALAYLLEEPFREYRGEKRLRSDFLLDIGTRVSFAEAPLYAATHESIYAGTVPGPTAWAAQSISEEIPGFDQNLDPREGEPFYLTGEHIFPWQFDEDPALEPFRRVAEDLAQAEDWAPLYDAAVLAEAGTTCAAAIYVDDIFVPLEHSLRTAQRYRDLRPWITNEHQHDGIRQDGAAIFRRLHSMVQDH